jgi:hypothetical protein
MNKTKRKMNKTKRKMNKTKRKMNIIREKRIRKRNKVNLHNKLMKGGAAAPPPEGAEWGGMDANLFGIRIPNLFFHGSPQDLPIMEPEPEPELRSTFRVNKVPTFNILNILKFLGIEISLTVKMISWIGWDEHSRKANQRLGEINYDIKRNGQGFNLIIEYFYLTIYLEQLEQGSSSFVSPFIKFNMKKMLQSFLISMGYGDLYSEEGGQKKINVIEPFRVTDIRIRFVYQPQNGELKLIRDTDDNVNNSATLIIGNTVVDIELTRELSY